ncbi:TPA: ribokinase [Streptococcus agalactiae]|nr:ribokinase [Streptococcus agalactiae]HEN6353484.1 ribokinase [Streptococcus agalactiae]HEN6424085.1 ribokinase [Streptococcus agalactiae]HEN6723104.1 ribokinase [Streptococcus agalactiae]HEN6807817.1 ribokinase [Streptococcus agalactiae]
MSNIVIIGSISMDLVMETNRIAKEGETVFGQRFSMVPGGKGANQAVAIGRLSQDRDNITILGAIGEDSFGPILLDNLNKNHVTTNFVGTIPSSSGVAQITLYNNDNRIIYCPGANGKVDTKKWSQEWAIIKKADLVVLQNEIPHQANMKIANFCKEHSIKLLYNPAPSRETDIEMLDKVDYFTPNEHECQELFPNQKLEDILATYPEKLIVTLGTKGAIYSDGKESHLIPALETKAVDTTGAGDTFNGAFGYAISKKFKIANALRFATLAAHLSVQKFGAQGGMPTIKEMEDNQHYEKDWHIK